MFNNILHLHGDNNHNIDCANVYMVNFSQTTAIWRNNMTTPQSPKPKSELKPCPFCGGKPGIITSRYGTTICCEVTSCPIYLKTFYSIEAWNTRANELSIAKAALTRAIEKLRSRIISWQREDHHNQTLRNVCLDEAARDLEHLRNNLKDIDDL